MKKDYNPSFNKLIQTGFVVNDLKITMDIFLNIFGIGPWYVFEFNSKNVENMQIYGHKKNYSMLVGVCPIGDVRFELIEPISDSIYSEYLDKYGEGIIHHVKFGVENYFEHLNYFESFGLKVMQHGEQLGVKGKNIYTYIDTRDSLGFISEIVDISHDFIKPEPDYWYPEKKLKNLKSLFSKPMQIGIVVEDFDKKVIDIVNLFNLRLLAVKDYSRENISEMYIYEKRNDYSFNVAFFGIGNIVLKVIKPYSPSIFTDFYKSYGKGVIHHLRMEVPDFFKALDYFKSKNIRILQSGLYLDKIRFAFIETSKYLNFITEIIDISNKEFLDYCP